MTYISAHYSHTDTACMNAEAELKNYLNDRYPELLHWLCCPHLNPIVKFPELGLHDTLVFKSQKNYSSF